MDENLAWKIVYAAALFSLFILGIAYYLISPRDASPAEGTGSQKMMEFRQTRIEGRKDGRPVWQFTAAAGWTEKNQAATYLTQVTNGDIFSGGRLVVTRITAPQAKIYRQADVIEATGRLQADADLGKFGAAGRKTEWTGLTADRFRYVPAEKKTELDGQVKLVMKHGVIEADHIEIDHEQRRAAIAGRVVIKRANAVVTTASVEYTAAAERADLPRQLHLSLKEKNILTKLKCERGTFFMDINKDISLYGSLEVTQGKKFAVADRGVYSRRQKGLLLTGRTKTILAKAGALIKPETAARLRAPRTRDILRQKTVVTADEIFFSTKTGDARAAGSVEAAQKGRVARSDQAVYNEKKGLLTLSGNVFMKEKERWLSCRQVVISIDKETFEALGVKEARFKL